MKTAEEILAKLKQHEETIGPYYKTFSKKSLNLALGLRISLLWALYGNEGIESNKDDLTKSIEYELLCHESSKIF